MLRPSVYEVLRAKLAVPPYVLPDDFRFSSKVESSREDVTITHTDGATFRASIPREKVKSDEYGSTDFKIGCAVNPGEITTNEAFSLFGLSALGEAVSEWAVRIAQDLARAPAIRAVKENSARIEELEKQLADLPDVVATPEQVAKLTEYLKDLENQFRHRIEAHELDAKEKSAQLEQLSREFAFLRDRVEGASLKSALRTLAVRISNAATDPKLANLLENGVKLAQLTSGLLK